MVRLVCLLVLGLQCIGCGPPKYIFEDPPVEYAPKDNKHQANEKRDLIVGTYKEQLFKQFRGGDSLYIIQGFQGGSWIHISVRVTGMPYSGKIKVSIQPEISSISYDLKLQRTADGYLEAYDIPLPVKAKDPESLYGKQVTLRVAYTSGEETVSRNLTLKLSRG